MSKELYSTVDVCQFLKISEGTLRTWMKWYKIKDIKCPEVPTPQKISGRNYWTQEDLAKLIVFKHWIPKGRNGVMGKVNYIHFPKKYKEKYEK